MVVFEGQIIKTLNDSKKQDLSIHILLGFLSWLSIMNYIQRGGIEEDRTVSGWGDVESIS